MSLDGHLWTIAPRLRHSLRPLPAPPFEPFGFTVEDPVVGAHWGSIRVSGRLGEVAGSDELVLVVHGLGGSSDSVYARRAARVCREAGLSCLRLDLRGSDLRGEDYYHAALTADLHAAMARPELARYRRLYLLGYSVGGHLALRLAAEEADPRLAAVAALCAPLDLGLSSAAFDRPGVWIYRRYVLGNCQRIYAAVAARRPVPLPVAAARRIRYLREWDERIVAPRHGFADAADYYERASVAPLLSSLRRPSLLVAAKRDPMVPAATIREALERHGLAAGREDELPPHLTIRWLDRGGHVAFPRIDVRADDGPPADLGVEEQVLGWLRRQGVLSSSPRESAAS